MGKTNKRSSKSRDTQQPNFRKIVKEKPLSLRRIVREPHVVVSNSSCDRYKGTWQDLVLCNVTKITDCGHREVYLASYSDGLVDFVLPLEQVVGFLFLSLCKETRGLLALYGTPDKETGVCKPLSTGCLTNVKLYHINKQNFNQAMGLGLEYHPADALLPTYTYDSEGLSDVCTRAYRKLSSDETSNARVLMEGKGGGDYQISFLITYDKGYHEFLGKRTTIGGLGDSFKPRRITKELLEKYPNRECKIRYGEIFGSSIVWENKTHLVKLKWVPDCNPNGEPGIVENEDGFQFCIGYAGFDLTNNVHLRYDSKLEENEHCFKLEGSS